MHFIPRYCHCQHFVSHHTQLMLATNQRKKYTIIHCEQINSSSLEMPLLYKRIKCLHPVAPGSTLIKTKLRIIPCVYFFILSKLSASLKCQQLLDILNGTRLSRWIINILVICWMEENWKVPCLSIVYTNKRENNGREISDCETRHGPPKKDITCYDDK